MKRRTTFLMNIVANGKLTFSPLCQYHGENLTVGSIGGWMPADHRIHQSWLKEQVQHVDKSPKELNPALKEFEALVKNSPKLRMLAEAMFDEIPHRG